MQRQFSILSFQFPILLSLFVLNSLTASAQYDEETSEVVYDSYEPRFTISSYGEMGLSGRNYTGDRFSTDTGAEDENSAVFNIPKLGIRLNYDVNNNVSLSGEVAYSNNTGLRLDRLALNYTVCPELKLSGGIFTLPIGYSNSEQNYMEHFTTGDIEGEEAIIPVPMTECGIALSGKFSFGLDYMLSGTTGANAYNYTAQNFAADSKRGFLDNNSTLSAPAATLCLGFSGIKNLNVGAGIYYCYNTARNMPDYSEFNTEFPATFNLPAPSVPLTIYFANAQYIHRYFTLRGSFMEGNMGNSYYLTTYFQHLISSSTNEGLKYDGGNIAKIARTYMGEVGFNVKNIFYPWASNGPELMPFAHYEYYNSQEQGQAKSVAMDTRGKVTMMSFGLNWKITDGVLLKASYTTRKIGETADQFKKMSEVNLGLAYDLSLLEL